MANITWSTLENTVSQPWRNYGSDASGINLFAFYPNYLYKSTDSGSTWTTYTTNITTTANRPAISDDGQKLYVRTSNTLIYGSSNSGVTWSQLATGVPNSWRSVTCNSDGSIVYAAANGGASGGNIWKSTDSGASFNLEFDSSSISANGLTWNIIRCNSNGTYVYAGDNRGNIYSLIPGSAWSLSLATSTSIIWQDIACSSDGTLVFAGQYPGSIYMSSNSGTTWTQITSLTTNYWRNIAMSATGQYVLASSFYNSTGGNGLVYLSTDTGNTWNSQSIHSVSGEQWNVGLRSDGTTAFATASGDYIYSAAISAPPPISNVCFPAGTMITTDQGRSPIERILPSVHTIHGINVLYITKTVTPDHHLICFEKDALGINSPSERTIISKNHLIFHGADFLRAEEYINNMGTVYAIEYTGEPLYNVLLECDHVMYVNNLICETLSHDNHIAVLYRRMESLNTEERRNVIIDHNRQVTQLLTKG